MLVKLDIFPKDRGENKNIWNQQLVYLNGQTSYVIMESLNFPPSFSLAAHHTQVAPPTQEIASLTQAVGWFQPSWKDKDVLPNSEQ